LRLEEAGFTVFLVSALPDVDPFAVEVAFFAFVAIAALAAG
jgi:hypothetical protein